MCQNGDLIFDAVDYQQTQYCVEASGETYLREHGQKESHPTTPLEMHMPRFVDEISSTIRLSHYLLSF